MTYEQRNNNDRNNFQDNGDKTQLFIAKGRNDGMDSQSLVEFVSSQTDIDPSAISSVKILDAFSFFAVSHDDAEMILDFFQEKAGEGRPLVSKAKRKTENRSFDGERRNNNRGDFGGGYRNNDRRDDRGGRRDFGGNGGSSGNGFGENRRPKNY